MKPTQEIDTQRVRAAKNQSLFREVNERIEELGPSSLFAEFICECLDEACTAQVSLTVEEYETVRRDPNQFFILPGHEDLAVERVIASNDRYLVVSKLGAGQRVAVKLDPRKRRTKP